MKRSEVNEIVTQAEAFIGSFGYRLPPFAFLSPDEMQARRADIDGILESRLGWDVTDYGQGRFDEIGLTLFTVRNGRVADLAAGRGRLYAEKIMVSQAGQVAPMHRHVVKAEDIINRGGGRLALELFASNDDGSIDAHGPVSVPCDGISRRLDAGGVLFLEPGESVTLLPGVWHAFWGEGAHVLVGEVSTVNDDLADNVFRDPVGRFPEIVEDEPPRRLLVADYDTWLRR
jgi:D-lyxose ketol-isomerase